jgi:hypothetical protein
MIVSVIKGGFFKVSWSLLTLDQHYSRNFFMHIMTFEIRQPTTLAIKIWLIIF